MNDFMKKVLTEMKEQLRLDKEQMDKYEALKKELKIKTESMEMTVKLLEAALNPEKKNDTIADVLR